MTDRELKKLKRVDLLDLLVVQSKEIEKLRAELEKAKEKVKERRLLLEQAGSLAEASLHLNHVFEDADAAAQQYLENVRDFSEEQKQRCAAMEDQTRERCEQMEAEAKERCRDLTEQTKAECDEMVVSAQAESQRYWDDVYARLEKILEEKTELSHLLTAFDGKCETE